MREGGVNGEGRVATKGDGERDKSKRKVCVSGGTKKKEHFMGVIEQQEHDSRELGGAMAKLKSTVAERRNRSKDDFVPPMNLKEEMFQVKLQKTEMQRTTICTCV
ncbi:hypothetical protein DEO72_LG3g2083 [Vigna unguiculata]|uniref:Uncharacterized protein n=1 Tax=Vigna unguiculata TaxID=3917 RepID=A0A4D6LG35_VIGUN|nr:hypothetical protein DEO72_LG3g2083 [Vigna unguiculata]